MQSSFAYNAIQPAAQPAAQPATQNTETAKNGLYCPISDAPISAHTQEHQTAAASDCNRLARFFSAILGRKNAVQKIRLDMLITYDCLDKSNTYINMLFWEVV